MAGPLRFHLLAERDEHVDGVLDGISARQLVGLANHIARFRQQHSFCRCRTAIKADKTAHRFADPELGADKFRNRVLLFEAGKLFLRGTQTSGARLRLLRLAADRDVVLEALRAHVDADFCLFIFAKFNCAQCGKILRILRDLDQIFRFCALRKLDLALLPSARDVLLPCFLHTADETVWPAQKKHVRTKRMPARKHGQVLQNNGIE